MSYKSRYWIAIALIVLTLILLYPGLTQNALTIRAVPDIASAGAVLKNEVLKAQIQAKDLGPLRRFLNQDTMATMDDKTLSDFLGNLASAFAMGKLEGAQEYFKEHPPYEQKQTIVVTIRYLLEHGGYTAGILLLLFSVCVPFGKVLLFFWALHSNPRRREKLLKFINVIGKWSMADVFVVSIYTAYLGARSSVGVGQPIHFETEYGPGFYWFAAYCVVALAAQQIAVALMRDWHASEKAAVPAPAV
jgi:hypothetical protein